MRPATINFIYFNLTIDFEILLNFFWTGEEGQNEAALPPLEELKEVKVTGEDVGDDRLGDEEWNLISTAK